MIGRRRAAYYAGVPTAPYDLVKEGLWAMLIVTILVVAFSLVLSSPDEKALTVTSLSLSGPKNFVATAVTELDGSSPSAQYGPPYNSGAVSQQNIGPFAPQMWAGIRIPVDGSRAFVLTPLAQSSANDPVLRAALATYNSSSPAVQGHWLTAYTTALKGATEKGARLSVSACACGPLTVMMQSFLHLGQSGAVDGLQLTSGRLYQTDFSRSLLFLNDIPGFATHGSDLNLQGAHWGVMNETGNYPGQAWLWLYTLWYQIQPFNTNLATNVDLWAVVMTALGTILLTFVPWIPGLNRIPRYVPIYRLIWKDWYRRSDIAGEGKA
ncbi:MAG: hypothetical protein NVSMB52_02630 [Chloroflexota bacterium]